MERPDLDTLACVNAECALHRKTHQGNLGVRKVYGRDALRLLRCRTCGEEFCFWEVEIIAAHHHLIAPDG